MAGIFSDDEDNLIPEPTLSKPVGLVSSKAPLKPVAPPPTMRRFDDVAATRAAIFGGVQASAAGIQPLVNQRHTLSIAEVGWNDEEETKSIKSQKEAILKGNTLSRSLKGTLNLTDNETGEVLDSKRTTLAKVPYLTDRGTFIVKGTEYTLANQMRLKRYK